MCYRVPVCEMPSVSEVHSENCVPRLTESEVHCDICWCAGEWLHVCIFAVEQFTCALNSDLFYNIGIILPTVVSAARVSFRIFVEKAQLLHVSTIIHPY